MIRAYRCSICEFGLKSGWGSAAYVEASDGVRVPCGHPGEHFTVARVLGLDPDETFAAMRQATSTKKWWWTPHRRKAFDRAVGLVKSRTGVLQNMVCVECLSQFELDLQRDKRECPSCASSTVFTANEMIGQPCPQCRNGSVVTVDTGVIA
jgi:hypothetical protein